MNLVNNALDWTTRSIIDIPPLERGKIITSSSLWTEHVPPFYLTTRNFELVFVFERIEVFD